MKLAKILAASVAMSAITAAVVMPTAAVAQQTTSEIRGVVVDGAGAPVAGASVTVTDSRTGTTRSVRTGANGQFQIGNLEVGGPYEVRVQASGFQTQSIDDVVIDLGSRSNLRVALSSGVEDEVIVTASRNVQSDLAIGPNAVFGLDKLTELPSIGRDIRDIIRLDPRVRIDGTNGDAVSCAGSNNRFNSFTIDGVRNGDAFGLNASGFVNRNGLPIPFDAIRETSVEFAPYDVEYGQFTGCNINVVTKSGGNEFSGSAFAVFSSQSLTGSTLEGRNVGDVPFRDYNWGATLGGPIIKDKLFFFVGYEEYKDNRTQGTGPTGGGFATEVPYATVSDVEAIAAALDARNIPTLGITSVLPQKSRRILTRWDWNITDNHRLAFTYQRLREFATVSDDFSTNNALITLGSTFFRQGTESETYSARLFSQWNDKLSTEIRASRANITDLQDPVGGGEAQSGNPIPRVIVGVTNDFNGNSIIDANERGAVIAGPGFSRSANGGEFQIDQIKAKADYTAGDHILTFGYELDQLDAFNLFAQNGTGTLVFQNLAALTAGTLTQGSSTNTSGANIFANTVGTGGASGAYINSSFTGDINDAAAAFSRSIHSVYVQDEWSVTDALTATLGLRYDFFKSGDRPLENANFEARYGFSNTQGYRGLSAFLPRLGLTYEAGDTLFGSTTFRAGAGVFTGGDPTVWFSNAFSNPGTTLSGPFQSIRNGATGTFAGTCTAADLNVGVSGALAVPTCLVNAAVAAAAAADGRTDAIDPNFDIPTIIRANLGFTHNTDFGGFAGGFFDDWTWQIDAIYSRGRNSVDFVDASLNQIGTSIDGRPIYQFVDPLAPGCAATPLGLRNGFSNVTAACLGSTSQAAQDSIVLTNALEGTEQLTLSGIFTKDWAFDSPIFKKPATLDLTIGYAFTDAEEVQPATSSVSTSNFRSVSTADFDNFGLSTSNYEIRHNATLALTYGEEFVRDLSTKFSFFFSARSGQPFSLTFNNSGAFGDTSSGGGSQRSLMYIPTGPSDPNVVFAPGFDQAAFFALLDKLGATQYAGGIAPRNAFRSSWILDLDMRFQQDLPKILGVSSQFFVDIENLPNLISDDANIFRQIPFSFNAAGVTLGDPDGAGPQSVANPGALPFVFSSFNPTNTVQQINNNESVWAVQFGLRFDF
ncbi:MAG TPA: hypothetical protein DDZ68_17105 [Parvularcula sp.]|nr:hypothetical protein [Parvularcula sp.]HBS34524.1 hypothetical protein [Parvularcula sp.]